jgi:hypothetical protein
MPVLDQASQGDNPTPAAAADDVFWVVEATINRCRQAVIHYGERTNCDHARSVFQSESARSQWHGPFSSLPEARSVSDDLAGVALRSECHCVPRTNATQPRRLTKLSMPRLHQAEPAARPSVEVTAKKVEKKKPAAEAFAPERKRPRPTRKNLYPVAAVLAMVAAVVGLLLFPAVSVVEARNATRSPFELSNVTPVPVTNLKAECSMELLPAAVPLHSSREQLADRLGSSDRVSIPCFQAGGGAIPQTSGMTLRVTVEYAILGLHHVKQDFRFVAARTSEGFCRWVQKG